MLSFNVLGCCVSRDIFNSLAEKVQVLQYVWNNPISIFSKKPSQKINEDLLNNYEMSGFHKNCLKCDYNKETLDYIFRKKSDYLIIDTLNSRLNFLEKDGHTISFTNPLFPDPVKREKLMRDFGFEDYTVKSAYDIDDKEWEICLRKLIDEMLNHYTANQIILFEFYGSEKYLTKDKTQIKDFDPETINEAKRYNSLAKKLNETLKNNLKGMHIIEFPENVLSIEGHRWGTNPLHYMDEYYEYAAKAVEIITEKLPDKEEITKLSELRQLYSKMFGLYKEKGEIGIKLYWAEQWKIWTTNALNFVKAVALDSFAGNFFEENIRRIKALGLKVIILKYQDTAAVILQSLLEKYQIEVVLETTKWEVSQFTDDEMGLGKKPDTIIISPNVHGAPPTESQELKVLWIHDLLEKDCEIPSAGKGD